MIDTRWLDHALGDPWHCKLPPICLRCGYNLTGNTSHQCPECGTTFTRPEIAEYVERLRIRMIELETINAWAVVGWRGGVTGVLLLATGLGLRFFGYPEWTPTAHALALIAGVAGAGMGLSVARIRLLPPWARAHMKSRIEFADVFAAIMLGLLVAVGAGVLLLY